MPLNAFVLSYPISVLVFTQVLIVVQSSAARQSDQNADTAAIKSQNQTDFGQNQLQNFVVVHNKQLVVNEVIVDRGKGFNSSCHVENPSMTTFWFRTDTTNQTSYHRTDAVNWNSQRNRVLMLSKLKEMDTGIYTCAVIKGDLGGVEAANDSWSNEERARFLLEKVLFLANENENFSRNSFSLVDLKTIKLRVRTEPPPVSRLSVRATTIIAVLIWEYPPKELSAFNVRSFTAEFRKMPSNENDSEIWERLDPINISPNIRQLEVYHLTPNTSYEFQIWANNHLGPGAIRNATATTKGVWEEKDLIRLIMVDAKDFDTRTWIVAVGIVLGTLLILSIGICVVLYKEWHEMPVMDEDLVDSVELVPNIILNPGFCDSDDQEIFSSPFIRRYNINNNHPDSDHSSDSDSDLSSEHVPFTRKLSIFFTEGTIKRI